MIDYKTFPCENCKNNVILNYAAAQVVVSGDYVSRFYFKCERCGQQYTEVVPKPISLDEK